MCLIQYKMNTGNRFLYFVKRPEIHERVGSDTFEIKEGPVPELGEGGGLYRLGRCQWIQL
jgi:hypothetical protein